MKRLLIIDDDPAVRSAFQLALEDYPYEVEVAESGEQGLEKVRQGTFDLVYLDLKMPGIDGVETLRRLRAAGFQGRVHVLTAFAEEFMEKLERATQEGLDFELIRKPLARDGIRRVTSSVLGPANDRPVVTRE